MGGRGGPFDSGARGRGTHCQTSFPFNGNTFLVAGLKGERPSFPLQPCNQRPVKALTGIAPLSTMQPKTCYRLNSERERKGAIFRVLWELADLRELREDPISSNIGQTPELQKESTLCFCEGPAYKVCVLLQRNARLGS